MMPALQSRMSRREDCSRKARAAACTRGKRGEVTFEKGDVRRGAGSGLDGRDDGIGGFGVAASEEDVGGLVSGQGEDTFFAQASGS